MNSQLFKIIGILESKTGISSTDDSVLVPITTFQRYLTRDAGYVNTIIVSAENADEMTKIQNNISDLLFVRHKLKDPALLDFSISNMSEMLDTVNQITTMFSLLLGSIAGISLLVGGIGIMNMMLTTVTERMREIGLRKAIGAKQNDISLQFLFEAVALTLIGGIIGIAAGWALSELAGYLLTKFTTTELQPAVSIFAIVLACGVSTLIGIIFGYYPARRAAKLNPIEALRYE
jgi:putative ABC transport system permease protein